MIRIALHSLLFDRGKFIAAVGGVAFAGMLVLVECGVYVGFVRASSALIDQVGGDAWVMGRGTRVIDTSPVLPGSTRGLVSEHPCVVKVRSVGYRYVKLRLEGKAELTAVLAGYEVDQSTLLPWSMIRGLPGDLHGPLRVTLDESDLGRLGLARDAVGSRLRINDRWVNVAGLTSGIKSFTLAPYLFAELPTLRHLAGLGSDEANFWVVDLKSPTCVDSLRAWVERHPALMLQTTAAFRSASSAYWVWSSGAGPLLAGSAALGLLVGSLIVAQSLYTLTKDHVREVAMLKTVGATRSELLRFVGWQALSLLFLGGGVGLGLAFITRHFAAAAGMAVILSPLVLIVGLGLIGLMCALASIASLRLIARISPSEVFQ
jgi:putative ABC transport system permease protein